MLLKLLGFEKISEAQQSNNLKGIGPVTGQPPHNNSLPELRPFEYSVDILLRFSPDNQIRACRSPALTEQGHNRERW